MNEKEQRNLIPRPDVTTPVLELVTKLRGGKPVSAVWRKQWHIHNYVARYAICGFRLLFNRKMLRGYVFALASLFTLIALGYAFENWRGQTTWNKYRKELQARGFNLDWNSFIATNKYLQIRAPNEDGQFVRSILQRQTQTFIPAPLAIERMPYAHLYKLDGYPPSLEAVAKLPEKNPDELNADWLAKLGGTNIPIDLKKYAEQTSFPSIKNLLHISGLDLSKTSAKKISYDQPCLSAWTIPHLQGKGSLELLTIVLQSQGYTLTSKNDSQTLELKPDISRSTLRAWFKLNEPWMGKMSSALQAKGAKLQTDLTDPLNNDMHNFVSARTFAQTFATGAKLGLVDNDMAQVWSYLNTQEALIDFHDEPPDYLITAMIKCAIIGLHADTLTDGIRSQRFSKADLQKIRVKLLEYNMISDIKKSWNEWERLRLIQIIETSPRSRWVNGFTEELEGHFRPTKAYARFAPRGWFYQNLLGVNQKCDTLLHSLDEKNRTIDSEAIDRDTEKIEKEFSGYPAPYDFVQRIVHPNLLKAFQTVAYNQVKIHTLVIVCGLEEYRLENGVYPEKLVELIPQYLSQIPNDVIDGQPMRYQRLKPDSFIVYSIGWNRKDEGGVIKETKTTTTIPKLGFTFYSTDRSQGDWVFRSKPLVAP